jgi:hypothetical protein
MSNSDLTKPHSWPKTNAAFRRRVVVGAALFFAAEFIIVMVLFVLSTIWELKSPPIAITAALASLNTPIVGVVLAWVFPRSRRLLEWLRGGIAPPGNRGRKAA